MQVIVKPNYLLFRDDCMITLQSIEDQSIDLIFTDPPYKVISGGTESSHKSGWKGSVLSKNDGKIFKHNSIDIKDYFPELYRVLKFGSHAYVMTNNINLREMLNAAQDCGFSFHNMLVWEKNTCTANRWYMKNLEYTLFFYKKPAKRINNPSSKQAFKFDNIRNKVHPTEKPVALAEHYILNSSKVGDIVLDPFMGSGSAGIAAIKSDRIFIGIEKDQEYFKIAAKRIKESMALNG
jgi:site-specific DNA-methyltransferase (adenine-specific)